MSSAAIVVIILLSLNVLRMVRDTGRGYTMHNSLYSAPYYAMLAAALLIGGAFSTWAWGSYFMFMWLAFGFVGCLLPTRKHEVDFTTFVVSLLPVAMEVCAIASTGLFLPA